MTRVGLAILWIACATGIASAQAPDTTSATTPPRPRPAAQTPT